MELKLEQAALGRKGDKGFKDEAYMAIANAMIAASTTGKKFTDGTIRNRCKNLKKIVCHLYGATECLWIRI